MDTRDYVSELHSYARRTGVELVFQDLGPVGPDFTKFGQRVVLNGKDYPDGVGKNKKEAKRCAAKNALESLLENQRQDSDDSSNKVTVRTAESTGAAPNTASPCFVVGDKENPAATGETKETKEEAATLTYHELCGSKTTESADEIYNRKLTQQKVEFSENVSDLCNKIRAPSENSKPSRRQQKKQETNYIGIVEHYCQKTRRCCSYILVRRSGPPHNPRFFYKLMIDNKDYPEAEGRTAKEARQDAARLAWSALQEQSDWDSKVSVRSTMSEDGSSPVSFGGSPTLDSNESPSQSLPKSTGASTILTDSPNHPKKSFSQTVPADDAPARLTALTLESHETSSKKDSIVLTDSSNHPEAQMPIKSAMSEDDPSTRLSTPTSLESLASSQSMPSDTSGSVIFTDSSNSSKDQDAVKDKSMGDAQSETSAQSRFTSEFDSIERLGSGTYGCVYKARSKDTRMDCAVKIVCCKEKSSREPGTLSKLRHPNIVTFFTSWIENTGYLRDNVADSCSSSQSTDDPSSKYLYIQFELCDTKTLKGWINEKNALSQQDSNRREESLRITQQIVCGVEYIHSMEHIHRDLKVRTHSAAYDWSKDYGEVTCMNISLPRPCFASSLRQTFVFPTQSGDGVPPSQQFFTESGHGS